MKITAIRATPINLPIEAPYWWSFGWLPGSSRCVVEVETDEGITGLGEASAYVLENSTLTLTALDKGTMSFN